MSNSLLPHELQHTRLPCPSLSLRACSNSCPLSQWRHPTISSSVTPFSCPQSFPASGSFPVSRFFASAGQSIRTSASGSVLPMNIQCWSPCCLRDSQESSDSSALSLLYGPTGFSFRQLFLCLKTVSGSSSETGQRPMMFYWGNRPQLPDYPAFIYLFIKKLFIEFVTILLLFQFFGHEAGMWDLNSLTRDQTHTFCTGRWSLNHWTTREVSWPWFILILQLNTFVRIPLILPLGIPCSVSRFHNSVSQTSWLPPTLPRTVIITSTFPLTFKHCHLARGVG